MANMSKSGNTTKNTKKAVAKDVEVETGNSATESKVTQVEKKVDNKKALETSVKADFKAAKISIDAIAEKHNITTPEAVRIIEGK